MSRFSAWLDELAGRQVRIDPESWHYKVYQYWVEVTGGNPPRYRENLCHYVRVLLIWAPWNWFKFHTVVSFVRPWTIAYICVLTAALDIVRQAEIGDWVAIWIILYVVGVAGILLTSWGLKVLENDQEQEKRDPKQRGVNAIGRFIAPAILVLALCFIAIPKFVKLTWEKLFGPWLPSIVRWFFTARLGNPWVTPFSISLISFIVLAAVFLTGYVVATILALIIIGLIIVVILLMIWGLNRLGETIANWTGRRSPRDASPSFVKTLAKGAADTASLFLSYLVAMKRGVCPFNSHQKIRKRIS